MSGVVVKRAAALAEMARALHAFTLTSRDWLARFKATLRQTEERLRRAQAHALTAVKLAEGELELARRTPVPARADDRTAPLARQQQEYRIRQARQRLNEAEQVLAKQKRRLAEFTSASERGLRSLRRLEEVQTNRGPRAARHLNELHGLLELYLGAVQPGAAGPASATEVGGGVADLRQQIEALRQQGNLNLDMVLQAGHLVRERLEANLAPLQAVLTDLQAQFLQMRASSISSFAAVKSLDVQIGFVENQLKTARSETALQLLSGMRRMGGVPLNVASGSEADVVDAMRSITKFLPMTWLAQARQEQILLTGQPARAGYNQRQGNLLARIQANTTAPERSCLHELVHHMEMTVPGLKSLEQAFYARRTKGEAKHNAYGYKNDEFFRRDNFLDVYIGKDYDGQAYELLTMGIQNLFWGFDPNTKWMISADPEYEAFVLGVLATQ